MIIVSQDRTKTFNFNNISAIMTREGKIGVTDQTLNDTLEEIGEYKTEERAKEVLKDIVSRYEAIELCKKRSPEILGYTLADYTPVYEMPEE